MRRSSPNFAGYANRSLGSGKSKFCKYARYSTAAVQWLTVVVGVPMLALYVFSTLTGG